MNAGVVSADGVPLVGPNAVTQLAAALRARAGEGAVRAVFGAAGAADWLADPPCAMVPQDRVARLHGALRTRLARDEALAIAREAGERTARYLLAHRIPTLAQALMRRIGPVWSARLLLALIRRNAWTFAGSGTLTAAAPPAPDRPGWIEIAANPLAGNPCAWHEGVFTTLFQSLVAPGARVTETQCGGSSDAAICHFEIVLRNCEGERR